MYTFLFKEVRSVMQFLLSIKINSIAWRTSDTRWACRADRVKAINHTLQSVFAPLNKVREKEKRPNISTGLLQTLILIFLPLQVIAVTPFLQGDSYNYKQKTLMSSMDVTVLLIYSRQSKYSDKERNLGNAGRLLLKEYISLLKERRS